jgi:hypothetical protein
MGVKAIDDISRPLKSAINDLSNGKISPDVIQLKHGNASSVIFTLSKVASDLDYLSENLKSRGYGSDSLLGRLKQAFAGLFGGF